MSENIYRVVKNASNRFTQITNELIENKNLSFKAKGIMAYILSKPDDWQVYEVDIINHATDGKTAVSNGVKELIEENYIKREMKRNDKGQFKGYNYTVYEVPYNNDDTESGFSDFGLSDIGKSNTSNKELNNTKVSNTKKNIRVRNGKEHSQLSAFYFENAKDKLKTSDYEKENIIYYLQKYKGVMNHEHPKLKLKQWQKVIDNIVIAEDNKTSKNEELLGKLFEQVVDKHFETPYKNCDYNIMHFISGQVMINRYFEVN